MALKKRGIFSNSPHLLHLSTSSAVSRCKSFALETSCLASWLKEGAIFHAYSIFLTKSTVLLKALKNKVYIQVIRAWKELFRFMALRTRRISFILHLSEVRLATRPVISMDMDGLRCIPIDPIGFHSTNRYRRIQSDNISALSDFHLTSGTFFASNVSYFLWKVLRIEFCQFHQKTTFPIGVYWKCTAKS